MNNTHVTIYSSHFTIFYDLIFIPIISKSFFLRTVIKTKRKIISNIRLMVMQCWVSLAWGSENIMISGTTATCDLTDYMNCIFPIECMYVHISLKNVVKLWHSDTNMIQQTPLLQIISWWMGRTEWSYSIWTIRTTNIAKQWWLRFQRMLSMFHLLGNGTWPTCTTKWFIPLRSFRSVLRSSWNSNNHWPKIRGGVFNICLHLQT